MYSKYTEEELRLALGTKARCTRWAFNRGYENVYGILQEDFGFNSIFKVFFNQYKFSVVNILQNKYTIEEVIMAVGTEATAEGLDKHIRTGLLEKSDRFPDIFRIRYNPKEYNSFSIYDFIEIPYIDKLKKKALWRLITME
jgi:hypothetical protein